MSFLINRRKLLRSTFALAAGGLAAPALIGRAEAAVLKTETLFVAGQRPEIRNGRVYYDNLVSKSPPAAACRTD